jgi:TatD DNase family protein
MWIDTHCHLDASEFEADRDGVIARARAAGVSMCVIPTVAVDLIPGAVAIAHEHGFAYALGIHPLYVMQARDGDLARLRDAAQAALADPRFVAIGEIGLDFYVDDVDPVRQEHFYREQLRIARDLALPVILHVRRSADGLLKHLRTLPVPGGIAHAFNGSEDQAQRFFGYGFRLGFGGAMTYNGSLRIRRLAATVPNDRWVLETDAPDIPPQWLREGGGVGRNAPYELPRIGAVMAQLRGLPIEQVAAQNRSNAYAALPRLATWVDAANATSAAPAAAA